MSPKKIIVTVHGFKIRNLKTRERLRYFYWQSIICISRLILHNAEFLKIREQLQQKLLEKFPTNLRLKFREN
jgi:hypothetical protein